MKYILLVAKLAVSAGMIAWLSFSGQFRLPYLDLAAVAPMLAVLALALLASLSLQSVRWWMLVRLQGIDVGYWSAFRMFWISQFFATFLPGAIGGDLVRGYYICRHAPTARFAGATSILLDRAVGLLAFVVLAVAAFVVASTAGGLPPLLTQVGWLATLLLLGAVVTLLLAYRLRALTDVWVPAQWRSAVADLASLPRTHPGGLLRVFAVSLISAAFMLAAFVAAAMAIGSPGGTQVLLATPAIVVANNLPISLGGLGVGEATAAVLFGQMGVAEGAAIMILVRVGLLLWRLIGAALLMAPLRAAPNPSYAAE